VGPTCQANKKIKKSFSLSSPQDQLLPATALSSSGPARRCRPPEEAGRRRLSKPSTAASGIRPQPALEPGRRRCWKPLPPLEVTAAVTGIRSRRRKNASAGATHGTWAPGLGLACFSAGMPVPAGRGSSPAGMRARCLKGEFAAGSLVRAQGCGHRTRAGRWARRQGASPEHGDGGDGQRAWLGGEEVGLYLKKDIWFFNWRDK
jgi:hypothetical protein